jgi:uncharacterized protein YbjT (DUF2867 family)
MSFGYKPTVLLTGATGFLGSHLQRGLRRSGYPEVIVKRSWSDVGCIVDVFA